jgi:uroporphyrinogen III methyltransferase/synthase
MQTKNLDARAFGAAMIGVVGKATASCLADYRINADVIPDEFTAESLLKSLQTRDIGSKRILLVRADRGSDLLPEGLKKLGAEVHEIAAYQNVDIVEVDEAVRSQLSDGGIHWITVTSSATAKNLHRLFGDGLRTSRLAAISPLTAGVLEELGLEVSAVADPYTMQGIVDAISSIENQ